MTDRSALRRQLVAGLRERLSPGCRLFDDPAGRALYATDASIYRIEPLAALVPLNVEDIARSVALCAELGVGVHARGAASGLAGESLGAGLVLDCFPGFRGVYDLNPETREATVGCGTPLLQLNSHAARFGLRFGPDPSSATRATLGGMIGTNATGAHSLRYGYTGDNLLAAEVVLSDGDLMWLEPGILKAQPKSWRGLVEIAERWGDVIGRAYPDQPRNRCGYNLRGLWDGERLNPLPLLAGSEGTLGIVSKATLKLVPIPQASGLMMLLFDSVQAAGESIAPLLSLNPASVELIDGQVIAMGRAHDAGFAQLLPDNTAAVLLCEFDGDSGDEVAQHMETAGKLSASLPCFSSRCAQSDAERVALWRIRNEAEGLIVNQPGRLRAVSFVEDTAVRPEKLGEWLAIKREVFAAHGISWATFGHAGAGELHTKVFVDLPDRVSRERLVAMADELYERLLWLGGSISGEHGDGLARLNAIPRQYPELFPAFIEVKRAIDPQGVFNPGHKPDVYTRHPLLDHARLDGDPQARARTPRLAWSDTTRRETAEACHGCGACRVLDSALSMCPLFKLDGAEAHSPRAKANLMRALLRGELDIKQADSPLARDVADACFNCKLCLAECPSHVDVAALMLELKTWQHDHRKPDLAERVFAHLDSAARLGRTFSGLANRASSQAKLRRFAGLDGDVPLPRFESGSFARKAARIEQPETTRRVLLYADYHVLYHDHALGLDVIALLNRLGWRVEVFTGGGCALPALDSGHLTAFKKQIRRQLATLDGFARAGVPILSLEPSAALALKHDWPAALDDERARRVATCVQEAGAFLFEQMKDASPVSLRKPDNAARIAHHMPCHLKVLSQGSPMLALINRTLELNVDTLPTGCCGMAGSWGLLEKNRGRSLAIAEPVKQAVISGAYTTLLSECSTCRLQLQSLFPDIPVLHPLRYLLDNLA
jgi:FAD/FMN-containing dehydrogenase/Fe-S oxidoreductase